MKNFIEVIQSNEVVWAMWFLKIFLGITFVYTGYMIFKAPSEWGKMAKEWAKEMLPIDLKTAMLIVAVF